MSGLELIVCDKRTLPLVQHLRYRVYCAEKQFAMSGADDEARLLLDEADALGVTFALFDGADLVSSAQVIPLDPLNASAKFDVFDLRNSLPRPDHGAVIVSKLVTAPDGRVLCFSRAPIPSRARDTMAPSYQQTGIMAFTWRFLKTFSALAPTPLEIIESVDMMRVLEHGLPIYAEMSESETLGVDTPADLARGEKILAADPLTANYLSGTDG